MHNAYSAVYCNKCVYMYFPCSWSFIEAETHYHSNQIPKNMEAQDLRSYRQMQRAQLSGSGFTYQFPINLASPNGDEVPFAVGPSNPKYYEKSDANGQINSKNPMYDGSLDGDNEAPVRLSSDGISTYKLKAPMGVKPKIFSIDKNDYELSKSKDVVYREDLNNMELKKKMQETNAYQNDVRKKHMELDTAMGMYVIALIAGVSAAVTVGLLAIGIGWYTYVIFFSIYFLLLLPLFHYACIIIICV